MTEASRRAWLPWTFLLVCVGLAIAQGLGACQSQPAARFPHQLHLAGIRCGGSGQPACLSCSGCHALSGPDGAESRPPPALCDRCHESEPRATRAVLAFTPERPSGAVQINHDAHLALDAIRGQCVPCHAGVVEANRPPLPPMKQCFTCHEHEAQWQRAQCSPCHTQQDLARTLPATFLRHDAAFLRQHGDVMAQGQQAVLCQSCHTQSQCQSCHDVTQDLTVEARRPERIESRAVHRGDFMVRHPIEARAEPARCLTCHTPQTCDSCHVARGVSANRADSRNPHPPEWIGTDAGSSNFHGIAARRDIVSCAGCHDAGPATNCIRCHKVGAYGGNPHPQGWKSAREPSERMCRYCHE